MFSIHRSIDWLTLYWKLSRLLSSFETEKETNDLFIRQLACYSRRNTDVWRVETENSLVCFRHNIIYIKNSSTYVCVSIAEGNVNNILLNN